MPTSHPIFSPPCAPFQRIINRAPDSRVFATPAATQTGPDTTQAVVKAQSGIAGCPSGSKRIVTSFPDYASGRGEMLQTAPEDDAHDRVMVATGSRLTLDERFRDVPNHTDTVCTPHFEGDVGHSRPRRDQPHIDHVALAGRGGTGTPGGDHAEGARSVAATTASRTSSPPPPLTRVTIPTREVEVFDNIIVVVENFIEIGRFPINEEVTKDEALRHAEMSKAGEDVLAALEGLVGLVQGLTPMLEGRQRFGVESSRRLVAARAAISRARGETP